jgi:transcription termination factor Rho
MIVIFDNNENKEQEFLFRILDNSKDVMEYCDQSFQNQQGVYFSSSHIRRLRLKSGDVVTGPAVT